MDERKDFGKAGEQLAVDHLETKGFVILERNWYFSHKEIDIIARDRNDIVVIEVKTRHAPVRELPEQAINRQKRQFLIAAANAYVKYNRITLEVRFDIVNVVYESGLPNVSHIRDAFFPTLW
jgi:putative endonuclease